MGALYVSLHDDLRLHALKRRRAAVRRAVLLAAFPARTRECSRTALLPAQVLHLLGRVLSA